MSEMRLPINVNFILQATLKLLSLHKNKIEANYFNCDRIPILAEVLVLCTSSLTCVL